MSLPAVLWSPLIAHASRPVSRGFVSLLFALIRGKRLSSPAQGGIRGVGAPSMRRPSRAAKPTLALTHPSNLRETGIVTRAHPIAEAGSVAAPAGGGGRRGADGVPSRSSA